MRTTRSAARSDGSASRERASPRSRFAPMRNRLALAFAAAVAALLTGAALLAFGPLAPLQDAAYDRAILWTSRGPVDPQPVTLVAIDEPSLRRIGPWPWPRSRVAELLATITRLQPRVLAVDLMLAGLPEVEDGDAGAIRDALAPAPRLVLPIAAGAGCGSRPRSSVMAACTWISTPGRSPAGVGRKSGSPAAVPPTNTRRSRIHSSPCCGCSRRPCAESV